MSLESSGSKRTKALLACGIAVGLVYLMVGLSQAFTRSGFDITRHDLSLLSNGSLGWIQVANFILCGLLVIAAARGMRDVGLSLWAPRLLAGYGLGLIGAGLFVADPALGFPPGTPADAGAISWHGLLHFAFGGLGFLAFVGCCLLLARQFARRGHPGWAIYSGLSGLAFLASFVGIASGPGSGTILGFWVGLIIAWAWLAAASAWLMRASREFAMLGSGGNRGDERIRTAA